MTGRSELRRACREDDPGPVHALGPRGLHIGRGKRTHHRAANDLDQQAEGSEGQHEDRHDPMQRRSRPGGRKQAQSDGGRTRIATIATQKSGALAPASDAVLAILSNRLFGRAAASDPTTTARQRERTIAITARLQRLGKASSATSMAGRCGSARPRNRSARDRPGTGRIARPGIVEAVRLPRRPDAALRKNRSGR